MHAFDIDSQRSNDSFAPDPSDGWAIPVGRVAGIQFYISYSVFVALSVVVAIVAMVVGQDNNGDLPLLTLTAISIWLVGWVTQLAVRIGMHFATNAKSDFITLGVVGVELSNPLHRTHLWSAVSTLANALITLTLLLTLGSACLCLHLVSVSADLAVWSSWVDALATTGFTLGELKHVYLIAAWLFWVQAACQAFPVPRHLGRGALAAVIGLFAAEAEERLQVKLLRKSIQLTAIITVLIALTTMITDDGKGIPPWAVLGILAAWLWLSSRSRDVADWIAAINLSDVQMADAANGVGLDGTIDMGAAENNGNLANEGAVDSQAPAVVWFNEAIDSVRLRKKRKLAKEALKRERSEADDASRLDHVLKLVSEQGTEGLSNEDKALLRRVSENLRRQRDAD